MDIGANIGYHTFRMSKLTGPSGRVYAVEPTSWAYRKLTRNASLNPDLNNITFSQVGLSNIDTGIVPVQFQSSYRLDGKQQSATENIELVTLDTYLERENIKKLDFIKLDVDGFEGKILQGAAKSLTKLKPSILMELNPATMLENGDDPDDMVQLLVQAGYHFETIHSQPIKDLSKYWRENTKASTMLLATPAKR
jgi:FkbM family methyltransferase